ncbi:cyclic-di-AMP receptor [Clostridium swellfunianum]|uniref:cyclic-di-AMP receptor n=1 Tax=Clostridium swellfunianum TaxID=1367462 RepID=UPI00202FE470|nr:cyclic-di-AMP receptor [Clostridium swellfunianum]MCM0647472.1 cyclic-di-AMP receptor [Clostridium swellfunianum]
MKLIIAIVHDEDVNRILDEFSDNNLRITKMSTTGGFLKLGNTTLLSGVENHELHTAIQIIANNSQRKQQVENNSSSKLTIGRATIFVVDVERFEKY